MVTPTTFSVSSLAKPYGQTMTHARMYVNATCDKNIMHNILLLVVLNDFGRIELS